MALERDNTRSRRLGLTKEKLPYGNLLVQVPQERRGQRKRPSPPVDAPPLDSSDDASRVSDTDLQGLDSPPPPKKSRGPQIRAPRNVSAKQTPSPDENSDSATGLYTKRSNVARNTSVTSSDKKPASQHAARSSPKRSWDNTESRKVFDNDDHMSTFQPKRIRRSYGGTTNIHGSRAAEERKKAKKPPAQAAEKREDDFHTPDIHELESRIDELGDTITEEPFKMPPTKNETTPRANRATRRANGFVKPTVSCLVAKPEKEANGPAFILPSILPDNRSNSVATASSTHFVNPILGIDNEMSMRDLQNLVATTKDKLELPREAQFKQAPSSLTASSLPSMPYDVASSASSLSSPPDSPVLDASHEHNAFLESVAPGFNVQPLANCPVCKEVVDRDFLESFDCGKRLNVRQQTRFCRAHKQQSANTDWESRGYPKIDWRHLDDRLRKFHPALEDVLRGARPSFYRNAFEDRVKSGKNRRMQQSIVGSEFEGLLPGYYGSRGARVMMEDIMSQFSSKIRRLAASDKLISVGGVSGYVQAVLVPELAVLLVMEDMHVDEENARAILRDSIDIGDLLNEEEDEMIRDPEADENTDHGVVDLT